MTMDQAESQAMQESPAGDAETLDGDGGMMTLEGIAQMHKFDAFNAAKVLAEMKGNLFEVMALANLTDKEAANMLRLMAGHQIRTAGQLDEEVLMKFKAVLTVGRGGRARDDVVMVASGAMMGGEGGLRDKMGAGARSMWQRARRM